MRELKAALELVLLFHSGSPWDFDKQQEWANKLTLLLGTASGRNPAIVGANSDGTWDGAVPTNEVTTKNLCNGVRAALAAFQDGEYENQEKRRMIGNLLDFADEKTKARVSPLLMELPLKRLIDANPYAGNSSDDCHTFS